VQNVAHLKQHTDQTKNFNVSISLVKRGLQRELLGSIVTTSKVEIILSRVAAQN
jgi:hypothetical protein